MTQVRCLRFGLSIVGHTPSVRTRTVIETDAPSVLCRAGGNVCGPGVSTTGPPSVVGSLGKVFRATGASTVSLRNVRDGNTIELLHPNRHLVGEES